MQNVKEATRHKLRSFFSKALALLLLVGLLSLALVFGMLALALYLNEVFYSTYQGFFVVAGGCMGISLLLSVLGMLYKLRRKL